MRDRSMPGRFAIHGKAETAEAQSARETRVKVMILEQCRRYSFVMLADTQSKIQVEIYIASFGPFHFTGRLISGACVAIDRGRAFMLC